MILALLVYVTAESHVSEFARVGYRNDRDADMILAVLDRVHVH